MLSVKPVTNESIEYKDVSLLYSSAFPENERRPLEPLIADKSGIGEVLAFYDGTLFCGFVCLLNTDKICHIIYFAVAKPLRGKGLGSEILSVLKQYKNSVPLIADVEVPLENAENNSQRIKRISFYKNNGFHETDVRYDWLGESYRIMSTGNGLTEEAFTAFWEQVYKSKNFSDY